MKKEDAKKLKNIATQLLRDYGIISVGFSGSVTFHVNDGKVLKLDVLSKM